MLILPLAEDMLETDETRISARQEFCSGRSAGRVGKAMGKQHPVACQFVDMGSLYTVASVGFECFDPKIIGEDQYDVGLLTRLACMTEVASQKCV